MTMTITELYEWAKDEGVEEYDLVAQYDTGMGACLVQDTFVDHERREVELCQ